MQLIDTLKANEQPKFAEVLIGQERGCTNGLKDTVTSRKVIRVNGSEKSSVRRKQCTGKLIKS